MMNTSAATPETAASALSEGFNVLVCVTGSVAALRVPDLVDLLISRPDVREVRVAVTERSLHFVRAERPLATGVRLFSDRDEWGAWATLGDPVLHVELRDWAHVLLIAPLSANSLAKVALGLCDNLVTCVARAWHVGRRPFLVAPAMNTAMWDHPITQTHLAALQRPEIGAVIIPPVTKKLACGDVGNGAMATPQTIAHELGNALRRQKQPWT